MNKTDREREISKLIAVKLGGELVEWSDGVTQVVWPHTPVPQALPEYHTDRNASTEIVQWFAARQRPHAEWMLAHQFSAAISPVIHAERNFWDAILATPRQICDAACKVWGIE
ncbi:hypothetical protein [Bacteriophage sp.]|nr:hypothetical protein [Bacteriophage sp.]